MASGMPPRRFCLWEFFCALQSSTRLIGGCARAVCYRLRLVDDEENSLAFWGWPLMFPFALVMLLLERIAGTELMPRRKGDKM